MVLKRGILHGGRDLDDIDYDADEQSRDDEQRRAYQQRWSKELD